MKLKMLALVLVFALLLPVAVQAATPRVTSCTPNITFHGTTASCHVGIYADTMSDEIEATITLATGKTIVNIWTVSANGYLNFSETVTVEYGKTYVMSVNYWVNGEKLTTAITSGTP